MRRVLWVFMMVVGFSQAALASQTQWALSSKYISNLTATLAQAKAEIEYTKDFSDARLSNDLVVAFPEKIPFSVATVYASFITLKPQNSYLIEVADKQACEMSKTCLLGDLQLQWRENPTIYYDGDNKQATTPVALHQGIQGFYTRGFPMADFWPAKLEWRVREVLYTLTWYNLENKKAFIQMANSVIDQLYKR